MTYYEVIVSFLIGIISGLIAGVSVSSYYRKKDKPKEIAYALCELKSYYSTMLIEIKNAYENNDKNNLIIMFCNNPSHAYITLDYYKFEYQEIKDISGKIINKTELYIKPIHNTTYEQWLELQKEIMKLMELLNGIKYLQP